MSHNKYMTPYLVYLFANNAVFMSHVTPYIARHKREYRQAWVNERFVRHPYLESFAPSQVEKNWKAAAFVSRLPEKKLLELLADCFPRVKRIYGRGKFSVYCKSFVKPAGVLEGEQLLREAALYLYYKLARFGVDAAAKDEQLNECAQQIRMEIRQRPQNQPQRGPEAEAKEFTMRLLHEKMVNLDLEERIAAMHEQASAEYGVTIRRQQSSLQFLKKQYEATRRQYELLSEQYKGLAQQMRQMHELRARSEGLKSDDPVYQRGRKFPAGTVLFGGTVMWARNFYKLHPNVVIYVGDGDFPTEAINGQVPLVLVNRENIAIATLSKIRKLLFKYKVPYEFIGRAREN